MSTLAELCEQLARGTTIQKRRAWRALSSGQGAWSFCQAALREADASAVLEACYHSLAAPWDPSPLLTMEHAEFLPQRHEQILRILAAAGAAAAADAGDGASLAEWSRRGLAGAPAPPLPDLAAAAATEAAAPERITAVFAAAAEPGPADPAALARDLALRLLGARPGWEGVREADARLRVPVLLAREDRGFLAWLWLERLEDGLGGCIPAAESLLDPLLPDLPAAIGEAWQIVRGRWEARCDVRWWLSGLPLAESGETLPLTGNSLQGAAAVGMVLLLEARAPSPGCAISAALAPDGALRGVHGLDGAAPKLGAAAGLRSGSAPACVIVSPENAPTPTARAEWEACGVRVVTARDLDEAVMLSAANPASVSAETLSKQPLVAQPLSGPAIAATPAPAAGGAPGGSRVVLLSRPGADGEPVRRLAVGLRAAGCGVFVSQYEGVGVEWAREMERRIREADLVVPVLTEAAVHSEMLAHEVQVAVEAAQQSGHPRLLPVHVGKVVALPEHLQGMLGGLDPLVWPGPEADSRVVGVLTRTVLQPPGSGELTDREKLVPPTGVLSLDSRFYVVRDSDVELQSALARRDSIVRVKGARQMGKTSLLARGLQLARDSGATVVLTDFQLLNSSHLTDVETFFLTLARWIVRQLRLDVSPDDTWDPLQGANWNFREFMLYEVLDRVRTPVVWALDEVDRLFTCDFATEVFALFRFWHNERALCPDLPWSRLTLAMSYATEAHLFLADLNQSPFNVGTRVPLQDFTRDQVTDLNARYGSPLRGGRELLRFFDLFAGHPYLTHRGFHFMASQAASLEELEAQADREDGLFGDHLLRILALLARSPELCDAVRAVLRGGPCPSLEAFHRLWSAGLLHGDSAQQARPRCQLYARYLGRHLQ